MFPKILDSTFPIATEEPGPGAFRCPGSPSSQRRRRRRRRETETKPPRREGARAACVGVASYGARGPGLPLTRASPTRTTWFLQPPPGPRVCARRAAALLRRGRPGTALPPAGAARAPPPCPFLRPPDGPRLPGSPPTQATRQAARRRRPVRSWILAGTQRVASSRRPELGLPPASATSSQLCRCRCRKRRPRNRLTSPPDHAGAAQADRSDESDLWKESGPRAQRHGRHAPEGAGLRRLAGLGCRPPEPARPPVAPAASARCARPPSPRSGEGSLRQGGAAGEPPPRSRSQAREGRRTWRAPGLPGTPGPLFSFFSDPSLVGLPLAPRVFPEDTWEAGALVWSPPVRGAPRPGSAALGSPSRVLSVLPPDQLRFLVKAGGEELSGPRLAVLSPVSLPFSVVSGSLSPPTALQSPSRRVWNRRPLSLARGSPVQTDLAWRFLANVRPG